MSRSTVHFQRWVSREKSTWPFQVFQKYNLDFDRLFWAHAFSSKYTYTTLGKASAQWSDSAEKYFPVDLARDKDIFPNLKDWSNAFNQFDNWVNLNAIMAISSNLEIYMASVISLALESDPGLLFGTSKVIDGVSLLKHETNKFNFEQQIISCTKGDWQSRASSYKSVFGSVPEIIINKLGKLEKIRTLRNKVGHAFGREIEESRKNGVKEILPMENLTRETMLSYQRLIWSVAKSIDVHLLFNHIGEYQAIRFYHELYPSLRQDIHPSQRAMILKKKIGKFNTVSGKLFCKELVDYYESFNSQKSG